MDSRGAVIACVKQPTNCLQNKRRERQGPITVWQRNRYGHQQRCALKREGLNRRQVDLRPTSRSLSSSACAISLFLLFRRVLKNVPLGRKSERDYRNIITVCVCVCVERIFSFTAVSALDHHLNATRRLRARFYTRYLFLFKCSAFLQSGSTDMCL